jgi:hypothetical protein
VHRLAGKIISSLPRWLLITMMIMVILTRDLACCRRPPVWPWSPPLRGCFTSPGRGQLGSTTSSMARFPGMPANDDQLDGPCVDDRLLHRAVGQLGAKTRLTE